MTTLSDGEATELARSVRSACAQLATDERVRSVAFGIDGGGVDADLWRLLCQQVGVAAIAIPEDHGGAEHGAATLGVVAAELGRALAPVPFLASAVLATGLLVDFGCDGELLASLASGECAAASVINARGGPWDPSAVSLTAESHRDTTVVSGLATHVLNGAGADVFVVIATLEGEFVPLIVQRDAAGVRVDVEHVLDGTRPMATVEFANAPAVLLASAHPTADIVSRNVDRALTVLAAEQVGSCERILEITTDYAKTREQFGRPIGSFQAIKHICSNMLANLEFARSAAQAALAADDDAGLSTDERHWRASMAKAVCSETLRDAAHSAVQVHGGIGFSWEGPAHLYLRRARTDEVIFGNPGGHWDRLAGAAVQLAPPRRRLSVEADEARAARTVPVDPSDVEDVEAFRTNVRAFLENAPKPPGLRNYGPTPTAIDVEPGRAWHKYLAVYGYACLDWPRERCGANASVIVQGIFAEECARLGVPRQLGFTAIELAGPILIRFGSDAQKERYLDPIRLGDHIWTQLFSEPGAGSDLASVRTKAERTENGWRVNGQKVWSSAADCAKYGLLLARTGTDGHRGLSMFIVPMHAAGVTVRPIKQIDGESKINEVFLENVMLSADALIGEVGQGWAVAMATLGRERITLGAQAVAMFKLHERMVEAASDRGLLDQSLTRTLTRLWARIWLLRFTWHRAVSDADMASSAFTSLKLMTSETSRDLGDVATEVLGTDACIDPAGNELIHAMFVGRAQTILGGTSEIQRNILAERVLGLPK